MLYEGGKEGDMTLAEYLKSWVVVLCSEYKFNTLIWLILQLYL